MLCFSQRLAKCLAQMDVGGIRGAYLNFKVGVVFSAVVHADVVIRRWGLKRASVTCALAFCNGLLSKPFSSRAGRSTLNQRRNIYLSGFCRICVAGVGNSKATFTELSASFQG